MLKNIINIVMHDFKNLFNNINLQNLNKIINSRFQDCYSQLQQSNNVDMNYFKTIDVARIVMWSGHRLVRLLAPLTLFSRPIT